MSMSVGNVGALLSPVFDAARAKIPVLVGLGKDLTALAFTLGLVIEIFRFWIVGGAQQLIAKGFRLFIVMAIPFAILQNYTAAISATQEFFVCEVGGPTSGVVCSPGGDSFDSSISVAIKNMWAAIPGIVGSGNQAAPSGTSIYSVINHLDEVIMTALVWLLLAIPAMIFSIALLVALYGPALMLLTGAVFGPILIAWLPLEPMAPLALNWVRYMITQGFAFAVGLTLAGFSTAAMRVFSYMLSQFNFGDPGSYVGMMGGLIAMAAAIAFISYMLSRSEHIASAMVGGPTVGSGGFLAYVAPRTQGMVPKFQKPGREDKGQGGGGDKPPTSPAQLSKQAGGRT